MRLNIGSGNIRFSDCINLELIQDEKFDLDVQGNAIALPFQDESFKEILFIHVIEHIQRKLHHIVFDEIWRVLKGNGKLIMAFPDFIEAAKRFIDNRFGARWEIYHFVLFGAQNQEGDFHVSAIEQQDITDRLISGGFINIKYSRNSVQATVTAQKGEQLNIL